MESQAEISVLAADWATYQQLLNHRERAPGTRLAYSDGWLSLRHLTASQEIANRTLASIVEIVAAEAGVDACHLGSTTFQRPDLLKGFEPDSSFYFRHADVVRDKDEIDLTKDPPPELVIEVDVTSHSLDRFPIFAAVGVAEVWRYAEGRVSMFVLTGTAYESTSRSLALPMLTPEAVTKFADSHRRTRWPVWVAELRAWVRQQ